MEPFQIYMLAVIYFSLLATTFFMLTFLKNRQKLKEEKAPMQKTKKVSIIIPAYNEESSINILLSSIYNQDYPKQNLQIIVVDDGSTDQTYKQAKLFAQKHKDLLIKLIKKQNGGKAQALNLGIKKAKNEIIMTIDADCILEKNTISRMLPYFENKNVMSVTSAAKVLNKNTFFEKMQYIEYLIATFSKKLLAFATAHHITPACSMYKKEFFQNYGNFDEKNLTEDLEMGLRIHSRGFLVEHAHDAIMYTKTPSTLKQLLKQRSRWDYGTLENILIKYRYMLGAKYAELGLFVLPLVLMTIAIMGISFILFTIKFISEWLKASKNLYLINFDFIYSITSKKFWYLLSPPFILTYIGLILGFLFFYLSKKYLKEKNTPLLYYMGYIFIYIWFLLFFKAYSITRFIIKNRPSW